MLMLSVNSAWAQYVKLTAPDRLIQVSSIENDTLDRFNFRSLEKPSNVINNIGCIELLSVNKPLYLGNVTDATPLAYSLALGGGSTRVCAQLSVDILKKYVGCKITGVRIGLAKIASFSSVEGWISEGLNVTPTVNLAVGQVFTFDEGWNNIIFSKPYTITGNEQDFYMGATLTMLNNQGSICTTDVSSVNGFFYEYNGIWYDGTYSYGTLAIMVVLEGNLPDDVIEDTPSISLALSCNNKGKVMINGGVQFTNNMDEVSVYDGKENTFIFQPKDNCELRQVLIDGLDVTLSVENNQLTTKVHEGSKMIVMFDKTSNDVNGDGQVDISDVVRLVNIILGQ